MKIRLTMQGGIYGTQAFEPVDTNDAGVDVPEDLRSLLAKDAAEPGPSTASREVVRTERQSFELEVTYGDGGSRTFRFSDSDLERDRRWKELFDCVWKHARPVAGE